MKGPTAKLMREMGLAITNQSIAAHYADVIDGLLIDERDDAADLSIAYDVTDTLMKTLEDRERVARAALALAERIAARP